MEAEAFDQDDALGVGRDREFIRRAFNDEELETEELVQEVENEEPHELEEDVEEDAENEIERPDRPMFQGFRELIAIQVELLSARDIKAIDHLLVALAHSVCFHTSYVHLLSELQWIKKSYMHINIPTTKKSLWKVLGRNDLNLIYRLYCELCRSEIGVGKKVQRACNCGACGPDMNETHVATFVQVLLTPQLKDLLRSRKTVNALQYKRTRVKINADAIEDIFDGDLYRSLSEPGNFLSDPNNFTMTVWVDGAKLAKSSTAQMYPILLEVNEFSPHGRKKNILLAGIWVAKEKPCMLTIFKPIVKELKTLYETGITWNPTEDHEIVSKFLTIILTSDSVARCDVLRMKQYNGFFGCTFCLSPGKTVEGRRIFTAEPAVLRTHQSIIENARSAIRDNVILDGVLGLSPLAILSRFNLVDNVVVDIVHNIYLGVVRHLFMLFFEDYGKDWYIGTPANIATVNERIAKIKLPTRHSRKPRSILLYKLWKASEWRNWLLYCCLPCLDGILPRIYFQHLILLAKATFILNNASITNDDLTLAARLLAQFISAFSDLYGEVNMRYNVHLLRHLPKCVRNWGPAWSYSTFHFESMNKKFVDNITSPHHKAEQIVTRFLMKKFVMCAVEEYAVSPVTRDKVEKLLNINVRQVHPQMPEGHNFYGKLSAQVRAPEVPEIAIIRSAHEPIDENTELRIYKKAIVHGDEYESDTGKTKQFCNHIAYCRHAGFIKIEKILEYVHENQVIAGFIGERFRNRGEAYATHYMHYVTPSGEKVFSSYKDVLVPGFTISTEERIIAVSLCNSWETD